MVVDFTQKKPSPFPTRSPSAPLSPQAIQSVSQFRLEMLEKEASVGYHGGSGALPGEFLGKTQAGNVEYISKKGSSSTFNTAGTSSGYQGPGDTVRQNPEIYSPLWLNSNINLPRDRATVNSWARAFYATNPMVRNAISLHSTYPISKLSIKCKDPYIENFFAEMIEEIDLMNVCVQMASEYWVVGESFPYADLDERKGKWKNIVQQNPDYIVISNSVVAGEPMISLRPDENLKRICTGNRPADLAQRQRINPAIVEHVRRNENIPLNNYFVHHLANKISPYDPRGTSLIVSCFKSLMLWDQFKECKFAIAQDQVNPWMVVKVGGQDYKPTPTDLQSWREVIEQGTYDKQFKIITHEAVTFETISRSAGVYDTSADFTQLLKEIYTGLMVPSVLMDGGSDTTYANGGVALDVLKSRYMQFRNMMTHWLRKKIFAPISKLNEFYHHQTPGKKTLIVPDVEWNHMSLFDVDTYIQNLVNLSAGGQEAKRVSVQTLYKSLGLDYEEQQRQIRQEAIQEAIHEREANVLRSMSLNDLRSLGPEDEIQESSEPLPGQELPGQEGAGGIPAPPSSMPPPPSLPGVSGPPTA